MKKYEDIQKLFNEVIEYSQQDIENAKTDDLFKAWEKNKSRFIEKWGGLTYEIPELVQFSLPESDKRIIMKDFIADCSLFSGKPEVREFLSQQGMKSFYENRVSEPWDKYGIKVNKGAKISKSLKLFFDDKSFLERFQVRLSRIIQDCKITGRMVMSVHPLDFISSSETAHNWHSCHALDGEYRAGNLSYMVDEYTFLVYLKAERDYKLPNFPFEWNSKKWRVLMYLNKDESILVSGRQYPFGNEVAMEIASNDLIGKFYDVAKNKEWKEMDSTINVAMKDAIGSLHYNDCLNSPSYSPVGKFSDEIESDLISRELDPEKKMLIGDAAPCLSCGDFHVSLSSGMVCDSCGDYYFCECCGETLREDDVFHVAGDILCECCADERYSYCEHCDEAVLEEDLIYDEETGAYYCDFCYNGLKEEKEAEDE